MRQTRKPDTGREERESETEKERQTEREKWREREGVGGLEVGSRHLALLSLYVKGGRVVPGGVSDWGPAVAPLFGPLLALLTERDGSGGMEKER